MSPTAGAAAAASLPGTAGSPGPADSPLHIPAQPGPGREPRGSQAGVSHPLEQPALPIRSQHTGEEAAASSTGQGADGPAAVGEAVLPPARSRGRALFTSVQL